MHKFKEELNKSNFIDITRAISYYSNHDINKMIDLSKSNLKKIGILFKEDDNIIQNLYDKLKDEFKNDNKVNNDTTIII